MKREMVTMLHYDAVYNPTLAQQGVVPGVKKPQAQKAVVNQATHISYLESHPYKKFDEYDLEQVCLPYKNNLAGSNKSISR